MSAPSSILLRVPVDAQGQIIPTQKMVDALKWQLDKRPGVSKVIGPFHQHMAIRAVLDACERVEAPAFDPTYAMNRGKAEAWDAVCEALNTHVPGWTDVNGLSGSECAAKAIAELAAETAY